MGRTFIDADDLADFEEGDTIEVTYIDERGDSRQEKTQRFIVDYRYGASLRVKRSPDATWSYQVNPTLGLRLESNKTYQLDTSIGPIREVSHD